MNERKKSSFKSHDGPGVCGWLLLLIELYSSTSLEARHSEEWEVGTEPGMSGTWGWRNVGPWDWGGPSGHRSIPHPCEAYLIQRCGLLTLAKHSRGFPVSRRPAATAVRSVSVTTFILTDS